MTQASTLHPSFTEDFALTQKALNDYWDRWFAAFALDLSTPLFAIISEETPLKKYTHNRRGFTVEVNAESHGYVTYVIKRKRTRAEQRAGVNQYKVKTREAADFNARYTLVPTFPEPACIIYGVQYDDGDFVACSDEQSARDAAADAIASPWSNEVARVVAYSGPLVLN